MSPLSIELPRGIAVLGRALLLVVLIAAGIVCKPAAIAEPLPGVVNDLAVASAADSVVTLTFTEVADGTGNPSNYEVRFATPPISWETATAVGRGTCLAPLNGAAVAAKRNCTVAGLSPSTAYNFQVMAYRGPWNGRRTKGAGSNVASATTTAVIAAVASVTVTPSSYTGTVGQTQQLTATTKDAAGGVLTGRIVTWASSNTAVARVSTAGMVTDVAAGTATITATSEGQNGQAQITVTAPPPNAPAAVSDLAAASTTDTSATLTFTEVDDGTGQPASYDVRYSVAPISWGGATSATRGTCALPMSGSAIGARRTCTVLGLSSGTTYNFQLVGFRGTLNTSSVVFGALSNVASASTTSPAPAPVATVTVAPSTVNGTVGQTAQLTVTLRDASGNVLSGRTVSWSSSNPAVATVSGSGLVTEVGAGTAMVTATSEGKTGQAQITVTTAAPPPVATVTVSPANTSVVVGQTVQLSATTKDANGNTLTGRTIAWTSGNTAFATVNASGVVTGVSAGSVSITATSEGKSGTSSVSVTAPTPAPVATVTVSPATGNVVVGATMQLTATTKDASGNTLTGRTITWTSSSPTLATVSGSGLVTGVAVGLVTFTATSEGKSGQSQLNVTAPQQPPPTGPDEPQDPGAGYLWTDDFDRYASVISMMSTGTCAAGSDGAGLPSAESVYGRRTAHAAGSDTQACNEEINAGGVVRYQLITGRNGTGKALRGAIATTTTSQGVDWLTPWGNNSKLAHDVNKTLVVQFYFRVSPGGLPGSVGMKWFELWVNELGGRPVQRLQWSTNGGSQTQWRVTDGPNTMSGPGRALQAIPPRLSTVNDGNWHRATFLFRANSSTTYRYVSGSTSATEVYSGSSSRDGRMAMWVDGIKIIDIQQSQVNVLVPGGGGAVWCYQGDVDWIPHASGEYIMWPSTINSPMPNPPWTLDHDDLKVWQF